jgi:hypothetical protein
MQHAFLRDQTKLKALRSNEKSLKSFTRKNVSNAILTTFAAAFRFEVFEK